MISLQFNMKDLTRITREKANGIDFNDSHFVAILNYLIIIKPNVDVCALFNLYQTIAEKMTHRSTPSDGIVVVRDDVIEGHDRDYYGEYYEHIINDNLFINFLKDVFKIQNVHYRMTADYSYEIGPGHLGYQAMNEDHYYTQYYKDYYEAPKEFDTILRFCLYVGEQNLRELMFDEPMNTIDYKNVGRSSIRHLGKDRGENEVGNKEKGFLLLERTGLPYPAGIVLSTEFVNSIISDTDNLLFYMETIFKILSRIGINVDDEKLAVRSNPRTSFPGKFSTEINMINRADNLLGALRVVRDSWYSQKDAENPKIHGIGDDYDMPIIIQLFKSGCSDDPNYLDKLEKNPTIPLYASGAFSTRNPSTNDDVLFGKFAINSEGAELMTQGKKGRDITDLADVSPKIYAQLIDAKRKIEIDAGPQEVEFVVNNGQLYFVQTRNINFSPQAEIAYIQELIASNRISETNAIPMIEAIQKRLMNRKNYRLIENTSIKPISKTTDSTPGAFQGHLIWKEEQARKYMADGKPIIFVLSNLNARDSLLPLAFKYPRSGLITSYGNNSSHEAVLTRLAGIASLININFQIERDVSIINNEVMRINGDSGMTFVDQGHMAIVDGDNGLLYESSEYENVLEENGIVLDASYGVDIIEMRQRFLLPYLDVDGKMNEQFTIEHFEQLHRLATEKFNSLVNGTDKKAAFIANLEIHFLHDLIKTF